MRRLFVVLALLAMMVGLRALQTESAPPGTDPLTLAAIGFVVLTAFALAELGERMGLPKVTGYIVTGIALGPYAVDILSPQVVADMRMFNDLALGLIATSAGLELDAKGLARRLGALSTTVGVKLALLPVIVGATFVAIQLAWAPLPLPSTMAAVGMSFIFSALALGTSPTITLAVLSETGARGPLAELTLGIAVLKDLVLVVCLAVATAAAMGLLGEGGRGGTLLLDAVLRLGAEIGLGIALAGFLYLYMRFVGAEMLLFVVAMILVTSHVCESIHLQPLFSFIVAGFLVRNTTRFEEKLLRPLEVVALPVFVVFFTSAGAGVNVGATPAILAFAVALCVARALAFFVAARVGAIVGNETPVVRRVAWMAYLPQAGTTLGLVGFASVQVPALSTEVIELGTAMVAINLLVGPIALRRALAVAGELRAAGGEAPTDDDAAVEVIDTPRGRSPELESMALHELLARLHLELETPWARWREQELQPTAERWRRNLTICAESRTHEHEAAWVERGLVPMALEELHDRAAGLRKVLARQLELLHELPVTTVVALEPRNARVQPGDPWSTRWAKRLAAAAAFVGGRRGRRTRRVPVRITARTSIEPALARATEESLRHWQRFEVECLETLERAALGAASHEDVVRELEVREQKLLGDLGSRVQDLLAAAVRELGQQLAVLGAPGEQPLTRYSMVEHELVACLSRFEEDAEAWPARRRAAAERLRFTAQSELLEHRVRTRLQEVIEPLDAAFARAGELVAEELRRVDALPRAAALADDDAWARAEAQVRAVLPKPVVKELRALANRVRRATTDDAAGAELRAFMGEGEERITVVASLSALAKASRPAQVEIVTVDARELAEVLLAGRVLPVMEECLGQAALAFSAVREQMAEVENLAEFGLEAARRSVDEGGPASSLDEALERCRAMLEALQAGACRGWETARPRLLETVTGMAQELSDLVTDTAGGEQRRAASRVDRFARLRMRLRRLVTQTVEGVRGLVRTLRTGEVGQAAEDLALRYRLRAGLQRLDAHAIRSFLDDQAALRRSRLSGLPGELFTTEPLRDPRLFLANRDALTTIVRAERTWQAEPTAGNAVLVVGPTGTGKSSTIRIAQLKLGTRRVIAVRSEGSSLRAALARALGVADEDELVLASLRSSPAMVVVDDLHQFFLPSDGGLAALEWFVALVVGSQAHTFWLLAMAEEAMVTWQGLVPLDDAFPCRVHLQGPEPAQLAQILEARRELGGQICEYPAPQGLRKLLRRSPQETYIRRLTAASAGNLRRALSLWRSHAKPDGQLLRLRPLAALSWRLPFVQQLREEVQAILALLVRHVRLPREAIAAALGSSDGEVEVHLRFLVASGLVVLAGGSYAINELVKDDVVLALREAGAVGGGGA